MTSEDWQGIWEMANSHSPYRRFPMDRQRLVQHWNEVSRDYDSEAMTLIDERIFGLLEDMSVLPDDGAALDIGCGTGSLTSLLPPDARASWVWTYRPACCPWPRRGARAWGT